MTQKKNFLPALAKSGYVHVPSLHYIRTGRIPSVISYQRIDVRKLFEGIVKLYSLQPKKIIRYDDYSNVLERSRLQSVWIELPGSITLSLINLRAEAEIFYDSSTPIRELKKIESLIIEYVKRITEEKRIGLIVDSSGALDVKEFTVPEQKIDIDKYYNDDFKAFDELLRSKLSARPGKGIVLLHGDAGTGKTSYLRSLLSDQKIKRSVIYLPPELSSHLASPQLISLLLKHRNSLLLLEDCENLLIERKGGSQSAISNLLNLSDGLLSDILSTPVICTFNAQLPKIDPALLRKGRLIARYHFKALEVGKANALLNETGIEDTTDTPLTLANIFNFNDKEESKSRMMSEIGFALNGKGTSKY